MARGKATESVSTQYTHIRARFSIHHTEHDRRVTVKTRNILLIIADQHRADTIGFTGQINSGTPNLDRMVREGISFDRALCAAPLCGPSRANIFTSLYAHQARGALLHDDLGARGDMHKTGVLRDMMINDSSLREKPVLSNLLRAEGYHTAYAGKWHLGPDVGNHREGII